MTNSKSKTSTSELQSLANKVAKIPQLDLECRYEKASRESWLKYIEEITGLSAQLVKLSQSQNSISNQYNETIKSNQKQSGDFNELKQKHDSLCTDYHNLKTEYNALK